MGVGVPPERGVSERRGEGGEGEWCRGCRPRQGNPGFVRRRGVDGASGGRRPPALFRVILPSVAGEPSRSVRREARMPASLKTIVRGGVVVVSRQRLEGPGPGIPSPAFQEHVQVAQRAFRNQPRVDPVRLGPSRDHLRPCPRPARARTRIPCRPAVPSPSPSQSSSVAAGPDAGACTHITKTIHRRVESVQVSWFLSAVATRPPPAATLSKPSVLTTAAGR